MKPGIYFTIPFETYLKIDAVSQSLLGHLSKSPAHCKYWKTMEGRTTRALDFGRAYHLKLLSPEEYAASVVVWRGGSKVKNKSAWSEFKEENAAKLILDEDEEAQLLQMEANCWANEAANRAIKGAQHEATIIWEDFETGILCKGRPDILSPHSVLADLKTAACAAEWAFRESVSKWNYHRQLAWYRRGLKANNIEMKDMLFVVSEKEGPRLTNTLRLDNDTAAQGEREVMDLLKQYAFCVRNNHWPGYPPSPSVTSLPKNRLYSIEHMETY